MGSINNPTGSVSAPLELEGATAESTILSIKVKGDTNKRLVIRGDGRLTWDDDSADETPADLYLTAEHDIEFSDDVWIKDDALYITNNLEGDGPEFPVFVITRTNEEDQILEIDKSGTIRWFNEAGGVISKLETVSGGVKFGSHLEAANNIYAGGKIEAGDETNGETSIGALGPTAENPEPAIVFGKATETILYLDESGEKAKLMCKFPAGAAVTVATEP